jgi:hypothetical protein
MNPQVTSEQEAQAFITSNRNPFLSGGAWGANLAWCDNYKKEGHVRSECWFLYPVL